MSASLKNKAGKRIGASRMLLLVGLLLPPLSLGDRAPEFETETFEGNRLKLSDWLGQPRLRVFSCPGTDNRTRDELERLNKWHTSLPVAERPNVLLIDVGQSDQMDWLRAAGCPGPTIDANRQRRILEERYEATWAPDFILLDLQGHGVARHHLFERIRPEIERLVQPPTPAVRQVDFGVYWPPHDPNEPGKRSRRPLLKGRFELRLVEEPHQPARARISLTLNRPRDEATREFWNRRLAFPEYDWMSRVRVWDRQHRWLWPNLPYLLRLPGRKRVDRYGGTDPGKGVDNDFAAVLIRAYGPEGERESPRTRDAPLVSAEWHPLGFHGDMDRRTVIHGARSDTFELRLVGPNQARAGKFLVWLIYADFLGFAPPPSWPKEPEFAGGALACFEVNWRRHSDGTYQLESHRIRPPGNTGFDWATWEQEGGQPRLQDRPLSEP